MSYRALLPFLVFVAACTTGSGAGSTTVPQPDPSAKAVGEVDTSSDAFCAGLITSLGDTGGQLVAEAVEVLEGVSFEECVETDLASQVGADKAVLLSAAFTAGCSLVWGNSREVRSSMSPDEAQDFALTFCWTQYFDTQFWEAEDYRILEDGVCYVGFGPGASVRACRDGYGNYIPSVNG